MKIRKLNMGIGKAKGFRPRIWSLLHFCENAVSWFSCAQNYANINGAFPINLLMVP